MDIESVEEATSRLQTVTDNIQKLLESEDGIATNIMNEHRSYNHHLHPTMQIFKPTTQIYTKLLSKHSMTNMEAVEKIIKEEASFFGDRGESAVEALWDAEEDYENAINSFEKAFQWESSSSTEIISKTGELAPIHASLTDVRNPDRKLSLGQLLDEIDTPKCHLVLIRYLR